MFSFDLPQADTRTKYIISESPPYCRRSMRLILMEIQRLERLELENKFIIDHSPLAHFGNIQTPPRFNNTTASWRSHLRDSFVIRGRILPQTEPYRHASFLVEITLPVAYPFEEPDLTILDPIYHPNVDRFGKHCCCWHFGESGKFRPPAALAEFVMHVISIIDHPEPDHPQDFECTREYVNNYSRFYEKALKLTLSYGRPRY